MTLKEFASKKDILNLVYIFESEGLHEVAKYWQQDVDMTEYQKQTFAGNHILPFSTVTKKKISVWVRFQERYRRCTRNSSTAAGSYSAAVQDFLSYVRVTIITTVAAFGQQLNLMEQRVACLDGAQVPQTPRLKTISSSLTHSSQASRVS